MQVLSEASWAALEPLVEECRPKGKVAPRDMRRTIEAIIWRCRNGAKWRALPEELGPWWRAAQLFIRWSQAGVWERLLEKAQEKGLRLGIVHLDGTVVRAHAKAAGAPNPQKGDLDEAEAERVRRLADLAAAMGRKPPSPATALAAPSLSRRRRGPSETPSNPARRTS